MPFAVVLLLDRATSRVVGVWETLDVARAEVALGAFARETPTVPVSFVDVRQFAGSAVYLAPTLSAPLRDAYRRAHAAFGALGGVPAAHFTPVAWVPHCTLAM